MTVTESTPDDMWNHSGTLASTAYDFFSDIENSESENAMSSFKSLKDEFPLLPVESVNELCVTIGVLQGSTRGEVVDNLRKLFNARLDNSTPFNHADGVSEDQDPSMESEPTGNEVSSSGSNSLEDDGTKDGDETVESGFSSLGNLKQWNVARSTASVLLNHIESEQDDPSVDGYGSVVSDAEYPELFPDTVESANLLISTLDSEGGDRVTELARLMSSEYEAYDEYLSDVDGDLSSSSEESIESSKEGDREDGGFLGDDTTEDGEITSTSESQPVIEEPQEEPREPTQIDIEIAERFYDCFETHEESYSAVTSEYDRSFPSRQAVLMVVKNAKGVTQKAKVLDIAHRVCEWRLDPESVSEDESRTPSPMGYNRNM